MSNTRVTSPPQPPTAGGAQGPDPAAKKGQAAAAAAAPHTQATDVLQRGKDLSGSRGDGAGSLKAPATADKSADLTPAQRGALENALGVAEKKAELHRDLAGAKAAERPADEPSGLDQLPLQSSLKGDDHEARAVKDALANFDRQVAQVPKATSGKP